MTIKLDQHAEEHLLESIRQFFTDELDQEIGELKARAVLEFCVREIAPSVYNQAIADAQQTLELAVADLSGVRYEPEFDYWKKHPSGSPQAKRPDGPRTTQEPGGSSSTDRPAGPPER